MALWLFRRKSRRKRSRANSPSGSSPQLSGLPRNYTAQPNLSVTGASTPSPIRRRSSLRRQHVERNKLQRRVRTPSFESGRADNLDIGGTGVGKAVDRSAAAGVMLGGAARNISNDSIGVRENASRAAADLNRIPTLHHSSSKRDGRHLLTRTMSSKRAKKGHDREREAEIRAMSNFGFYGADNDFTPVRPAAQTWTAGRPMKRDTIKAHYNIFSSRSGRDKENQPSDVSLPNADSIDTAMSSDSEPVAFVISPFAALAPKPTLRYASQPRVGPPSGGSFPTRNASQKRKLSVPIPEATLRAHKRVDDLADDMNTSDLRELMERDMRRRERKREHEKERAARRLARQAERQENLEAQVSSTGSAEAKGSRASPDMARGVLGREAVGLGIGTTSAVVTSATRRESPSPVLAAPTGVASNADEETGQTAATPPPASHDSLSAMSMQAPQDMNMSGAVDDRSSEHSRRRVSPVDLYHRPYSTPPPPSDPELQAPLPRALDQNANALPVPARTGSKLRKLTRLRKRLSNASSLAEKRASIGKPDRVVTLKSSNSGSSRSRGHLSWSSLGALFRWSARSKQGSGPSSFSNLSRDSMAAQSSIQRLQQLGLGSQAHSQHQLQAQSETPGSTTLVVAVQAPINAHPLKVKSGVPQRALSRFKEDLPDFLMSPPASRVQSPEAEPMAIKQQQQQQQQRHNILLPAPVNDDDDASSIIMTPIAFHHPQPQQTRAAYDNNSIDNSIARAPRDTPTSWFHGDENDPSPEPQQSLSLASIDSEGSWLAGGATARRRAAQTQRSLDSVSRYMQQQQQQKAKQPQEHLYREPSWTSDETDSIHAQRSMSPISPMPLMSPGAAELIFAARATMAASNTDDDNADVHLGTVAERHVESVSVPYVVKSREGLMTAFYMGEEGHEKPDSPTSPVSMVSPTSQASSELKDDEGGLQRATSVNLGTGHVRHISAGSAKLLDISLRNSVDAKARSHEPLF